MKNSMKLVISDNEVSLVQMALAREHHDRRGVFQNLQAQGHVRILTTEDPARIHVQCDEETFYDERARFPTVVLMAKLQLAIAAGRSCRNLASGEGFHDHSADALSYAINTGNMYRQVLQYEQSKSRLNRPVGKSPMLAWRYDGDAHIGQVVDGNGGAYPEPPAPRSKLEKRVTAAVKKFAKGLRP